jgi:hypothetical protein
MTDTPLRYWRVRLRLAGWVNRLGQTRWTGNGTGRMRRLAARLHGGYAMTYTMREPHDD